MIAGCADSVFLSLQTQPHNHPHAPVLLFVFVVVGDMVRFCSHCQMCYTPVTWNLHQVFHRAQEPYMPQQAFL